MTALVIVVDKGSGAPETIIEECLEVFKRWFDNADPVISKRQGNYETFHQITPGLKKLRSAETAKNKGAVQLPPLNH